jgi:hypothetical protein
MICFHAQTDHRIIDSDHLMERQASPNALWDTPIFTILGVPLSGGS